MAGEYVARACMAGDTATAADGTHPTGMHSCWQMTLILRQEISDTVHKLSFCKEDFVLNWGGG